ncbi:MAG: molybdopterin-guanine dinucleotide biosynthesis protein B [Syntrophomonadaceae bacterium]|nr:molybdopterin-guanine dinucleotide biosynthesis protein B [Syntrophomonadaceae bacterium]
MPPVVSFVGRHNSGKTTLLTGVIKQLKREGIRVAVIKHAQHLDIDTHDAGRLYSAGADQVLAASPNTLIQYQRQEREDLLTLLDKAGPADLIITEGFKQYHYPKIEVLRKDIDPNPLPLDNVIARVSDFDLSSCSEPGFSFEQTDELSRFLIKILRLKTNI